MFQAKPATSQNIASTAATKVLFGSLVFDDAANQPSGAIYDISTSRVTPRAGRHGFHAVLQTTNIAEAFAVAIYKDGVLWEKRVMTLAAGESAEITAYDKTDGTHYYEVFADSTADASYDIGTTSVFESWELA